MSRVSKENQDSGWSPKSRHAAIGWKPIALLQGWENVSAASTAVMQLRTWLGKGGH